MLSLHALRGKWRRISLERPGEPPDLSSSVHWLQGPRFFVDLRQPIDPPDFTGIGCLRQLQSRHLTWLAGQQGFAGSLNLTADVAWWRRGIDFQPQTAAPDRARLRIADQFLEERGTEVTYLEKWEREAGPVEPAYGLRLTDPASMIKGYLVRVGSRFMYARARPKPLTQASNLAAILDATAGLTDKQDLFDFEISLGRIDPEGEVWRIDRSSLPFRQGAILASRLHPVGDQFSIKDVDCHGTEFIRRWVVSERDTRADERSQCSASDGAFIETEPAIGTVGGIDHVGGAP